MKGGSILRDRGSILDDRYLNIIKRTHLVQKYLAILPQGIIFAIIFFGLAISTLLYSTDLKPKSKLEGTSQTEISLKPSKPPIWLSKIITLAALIFLYGCSITHEVESMEEIEGEKIKRYNAQKTQIKIEAGGLLPSYITPTR